MEKIPIKLLLSKAASTFWRQAGGTASPRYFSPCQTRLQQIENYLTIIGKLMAKLLFRLDIAKAIKRSLSALLMSVGDSLVLN